MDNTTESPQTITQDIILKLTTDTKNSGDFIKILNQVRYAAETANRALSSLGRTKIDTSYLQQQTANLALPIGALLASTLTKQIASQVTAIRNMPLPKMPAIPSTITNALQTAAAPPLPTYKVLSVGGQPYSPLALRSNSTAIVQSFAQQDKAAAASVKQIEKYRQAHQGAADATKKNADAAKQFKLGIGFNLPTFLTGYLTVATIKELSGYITQIARSRDLAQSLGGSGRDVTALLPHQRDAQLFSQFASQQFTNRFTSQTEISGLKNVRDTLMKSLGDDFGQELSLKLTNAFQGSSRDLQTFLAMASKSVPEALRAFQSQDVETFTTALSGATQKTSELSKTANSLETAWRDTKDAFEDLAKDIISENGGNIRTMIDGIAQSVVAAINTMRVWGSEAKPVFEFLLGGFRMAADAAKYWDELFNSRTDQNIAKMEALGQESKRYLSEAQKARAAGNESEAKRLSELAKKANQAQQEIYSNAQKQWGHIPELVLKSAEKVETYKGAMNDALAATKKERAEVEAVQTAASKSALNIQRISEDMKLTDAGLAAAQSALDAAATSPFAGFATADKAVQVLSLLETKRIQLQETLNNINQNTQKGRIEALEIEAKINSTIAQRNQLLQGQQKGYLDAVIAQQNASQRLAKIIIDQDSNLGAALARKMVKANPYLGSTGTFSNVSPFQYGVDMASNVAAYDKYRNQLGAWMNSNGQLDALRAAALSRPIVATSDMANTLVSSQQQSPKTTIRSQTVNTSQDGFDKLDQAGQLIIEGIRDVKSKYGELIEDERPTRPGGMGARAILGTGF